MYISKAKARELLGTTGVTSTQLRKVEKQLTTAAKQIKDVNRNGEADNFEVARAVKSAKLGDLVATVLWSAKGTAFMLSDSDGRANVATQDNIKAQIKGSATGLARRGSGGKLTAEDIQGKTLGNYEIAFLKAAKAAR
jgi:hypothetical protein